MISWPEALPRSSGPFVAAVPNLFRESSELKMYSLVRCGALPAPIVGDCSYCHGRFCGAHRLPEAHCCAAMAACRAQAFERNAARVQAEKCVAAKVPAC